MNNYPNVPVTSGKIDVWVRTSILSRITDLMLLGSKKAVLSWDVDAKTVVLSEVDKNNATINTIFTASALQVTGAHFPPGKNFFISIDGKQYDISMRGKYSNTPFMADAVDAIDGVIEDAYLEKNSDISHLRTFLKKENPDKIYVSQLNAHTNLKVSVILIVAILVVIAAIGFIFNR